MAFHHIHLPRKVKCAECDCQLPISKFQQQRVQTVDSCRPTCCQLYQLTRNLDPWQVFVLQLEQPIRSKGLDPITDNLLYDLRAVWMFCHDSAKSQGRRFRLAAGSSDAAVGESRKTFTILFYFFPMRALPSLPPEYIECPLFN
jgi:hypothetical protein